MTEKQVIKIRDVDKDIATRLVTVAKEKDYASRDEMLRDVLKKIA